MENIELFLEKLRMYEAGKCELEEVRHYFEPLDRFHEFGHYLSDADIREKDADYAEMQNGELRKFIVAIEEKDYDRAQNITFLSDSGV